MHNDACAPLVCGTRADLAETHKIRYCGGRDARISRNTERGKLSSSSGGKRTRRGFEKVYGTAGREEMRDTIGSSAVLLISTGRDRRTHILSVLRREDAAAFGDAFTSAAIAKYLDDVCS